MQIDIPLAVLVAGLLLTVHVGLWKWASSPHALGEWAEKRGLRVLPHGAMAAGRHVRSIRVAAAGALTFAFVTGGAASIWVDPLMTPWMAAALGFLAWVSLSELRRGPLGEGHTQLIARRALEYAHRRQPVISMVALGVSLLTLMAVPPEHTSAATIITMIALLSSSAGWLLVRTIANRRYQVSDMSEATLEDALRRDAAVLVAGASTAVLVAAAASNLALVVPNDTLVNLPAAAAVALSFSHQATTSRPPSTGEQPAPS